MSSSPQLGWIGLGSMGLAMAVNLQKHLQATKEGSLLFTNRTMERGAALEKLGGVPIASISGVVKRSDIVFISISDDAVLEAVVKEILASGDVAGKIVVDTSTVSPDSSVAASEKLQAAGAMFVAAPVFGSSHVAQAGQLLFILAGPSSALLTLTPYIKNVMGRSSINLGPSVRKAALMKTTGNFITAALMEVVAEAHVLAEKTGLGSHVLEELISENYGSLMKSMSVRMTGGGYVPKKGSKSVSDLDLAIKDVGHGMRCAEEAGVRMGVGEVVLGHLRNAESVSRELGRPMDSSALYGVVRREGGLEFESEVVKRRDAQEM